jgi:phage shock protein PspC (stress-responsive transcriptional regulator)
MKKLHVSNREKMIGGVCAGLSESLGMDVTIIRLIFVISLFLGGSGLLAYLLLLLVLPKGDDDYLVHDERERPTRLFRSWEKRMIAGICGGIANHLQLDESIVRLVFLGLLFTGIGIPIYLVLWLIIPLEQA